MKREEMNRTIGDELEHIPQFARGTDQNLFRAVYNMIRRHDLGQNPAFSRSASLENALKEMRTLKPNFVPEYESDFFHK